MKMHIVVFSLAMFLATAGLACGAATQPLPGPPPSPPTPAAVLPAPAGAGPVVFPAPGGPPPPPPMGGRPPLPEGPPVAAAPAVPLQALMADLPRARAVAREISGKLVPGEVRLARGPGGEVDLAAELLYRGAPVAVLHFDPRDGGLLPLGVPPHAFGRAVPPGAARDRLAAVAPELKVLPAAEFLAPEGCWTFPVVRGDTVVARVRVYHDGIHMAPQRIAEPGRMIHGR